MIFSVKSNFLIIFIALTLIKLISANNSSDTKHDAKCFLPMEPGPCSLNLKRFYYNANTDTCEEFKFGGCMGNGNKFGFKQTCEMACSKKSTGAISKSATTASTTTEANKKTDNVKIAAATTARPVAARSTAKISTQKNGITAAQTPK